MLIKFGTQRLYQIKYLLSIVWYCR